MMEGLIREMDAASRVLVLAHRDPDGDALGACLGLMHLLTPRGKRVFVHACGVIGEEWGFLPGRERVHSHLPASAEVDLAVLLDCHQPERAGSKAQELLPRLARVAVVDHHLGRADFGQARWVDPAYAATCEMLAELARAAGWAINRQAATCLFVGVQTDTGRFGYSNTTPRTLRLGAELVELGAEPWAITQQAYSTSLARLRLMGRVFAGLKLLAGGRVALGRVGRADLDELGALPSDLDRVVEEIRAVRGVEVAVLLKELPEGGVKASLRSRGGVDVGSLAIGLGGGGHKSAAGARLAGDLDQAETTLAGLLAPLAEAAS